MPLQLSRVLPLSDTKVVTQRLERTYVWIIQEDDGENHEIALRGEEINELIIALQECLDLGKSPQQIDRQLFVEQAKGLM